MRCMLWRTNNCHRTVASTMDRCGAHILHPSVRDIHDMLPSPACQHFANDLELLTTWSCCGFVGVRVHLAAASEYRPCGFVSVRVQVAAGSSEYVSIAQDSGVLRFRLSTGPCCRTQKHPPRQCFRSSLLHHIQGSDAHRHNLCQCRWHANTDAAHTAFAQRTV